MGCPCPPSAALETIPTNTCPIDWDRVNGFSIARQFAFHSVLSGDNSTVSELKTLAQWVDALAATGVEKQLIFKIVGELSIAPGEAQTSTFDGEERNTGSYAPSTVVFQANLASDQLESGRKLTCETDLWIMFFDKAGNIIHGQDASNVPGGFKLSPQSWFLSDMGQADAGGLVLSNGGFQLKDGWSVGTNVTVSEPTDFDPLTDLSN